MAVCQCMAIFGQCLLEVIDYSLFSEDSQKCVYSVPVFVQFAHLLLSTISFLNTCEQLLTGDILCVIESSET